MANHMAEVAKMLGVELGEEFECNNGYVYQFTDVGIICPKYCRDEEDYSGILQSLLNGRQEIKLKPWKPKENEDYWLVNQCGNVISLAWIDNLLCITNYKLGNCYRTREEAEANRDKWIKFYTSDEVLEVQLNENS